MFLDRRLSDESLGRRLASGEAPAFDELYRRYAHRLAAYGTHLLGDASAGDDVAQVALMRAYQALREGRAPASLGPWLYGIAHNAAIDSVRNRREWPTEFLPERGREQAGGEVGALTAAIAALPERQRQVYVLRELHGLRIGEAAAELGLSNAQVEQALFAARNRLAEQLVFGERLSCSAVQRLAAGSLDSRERRALKTHVRSCPSCRKQLGLRGMALSLPLPPFGWLRAGLGGGGVPVAAKIGVVAATATLAVGVPVAVLNPHHGFSIAPVAAAAGPDAPLQLGVTSPALDPAVLPAATRPALRKRPPARRAAAPLQQRVAPVFTAVSRPLPAATAPAIRTAPAPAPPTVADKPAPGPQASSDPTSTSSGDGGRITGGDTTVTIATAATTSDGGTSDGGTTSGTDGGTSSTSDGSGSAGTDTSGGTSDGTSDGSGSGGSDDGGTSGGTTSDTGT